MLNQNDVISAHKARQNFYQLLDRVAKNDQIIRIRRRNGQAIVMLPEAELESWLETMDILSNTKLMKQIRQSKEDIQAGKVITLDELDKMLDI